MSESLPMLQPFAALRPAPGRAAEVLAPPYDVLSSAEARQRAQGKPWSFLHVSKAEIDLPEDVDVHAPEVYAKAGENIRAMVEAGVLVRDDAPGYYAYRLVMGDHVQTGVVAAGSIADYDANRIRRHEFTRPDKEDDRVAQIEAVLGAVVRPTRLTLRVHPDDLHVAKEELPSLVARFDQCTHAELIEDASLSPGSGVATTEGGGRIEADVRAQLERVVAEMLPAEPDLKMTTKPRSDAA